MKINKRKFWLRLIVWPLILVILFIPHMLFVLKRTYHFVIYGGEWVNFEKPEHHTIGELYEMLKEIKEQKSDSNEPKA